MTNETIDLIKDSLKVAIEIKDKIHLSELDMKFYDEYLTVILNTIHQSDFVNSKEILDTIYLILKVLNDQGGEIIPVGIFRIQ